MSVPEAVPGGPLPQRIAMLSFHTSPLAPLGGRETGGMNVYVLEVARGLAALGVTVDVFTRRTDEAGAEVEEFAPGARLVQVTAGPEERIEKEDLLPYIGPFVEGVDAFRARHGLEYEAIYSHYWLSVVAGDLLAARWGAPHAGMFHTLGDVKLRARASESERPERLEAERRLVHRLDRIVAATEHERQLLRQIFRVDGGKVAVIPLGVDLRMFTPRPQAKARARLGLDPERRSVLAVGRIEPLKGLDILIRAIGQLQSRVPVDLLVIGGDERAASEVARLQAIAAEVGAGSTVRFLGPKPHESLADWYAAADVVAVPSFYESFGLVAVEAMACGTPVVASRVGGLASTVVDGRTGYLVPWRCPEPFAERIELLLRNEPLRLALGAAGVERMRAYDWSAVAARVGATLAALVEEHRRGLAS
ncbi:MAG: glycosyltransferase family 1 protein [Dehalococcoidia bacterium]|nr:MAG: glycosyltransferase family 1 protein [Dehalococcoidia bacterium]